MFFRLEINNCCAENDVYEGRIKNGKVKLEHLSVSKQWKGSGYKEKRRVISSVKGGEALCNEVETLLKESLVYSWDGFYGPNPPEILDGSSMIFHAELDDGQTIDASGNNNFPEGYGRLNRGLYELVNKDI